MSNTTIAELERKARLGFVTGGVPRLLPEDRVYHTAVLATWVEPECVLGWMDDLEDRAAVLLADWAAEHGETAVAA